MACKPQADALLSVAREWRGVPAALGQRSVSDTLTLCSGTAQENLMVMFRGDALHGLQGF